MSNESGMKITKKMQSQGEAFASLAIALLLVITCPILRD